MLGLVRILTLGRSLVTPPCIRILVFKKNGALDNDSYEATCTHDAETLYNLLANDLPSGTFRKLFGKMSDLIVPL